MSSLCDQQLYLISFLIYEVYAESKSHYLVWLVRWECTRIGEEREYVGIMQCRLCNNYCCYKTELGKIAALIVSRHLRGPVWLDDGVGNSLYTEPMCMTKSVVADCPWWHQNSWKVCSKQFCSTGTSQFRNSRQFPQMSRSLLHEVVFWWQEKVHING